jgi:hypothetical protein
MPPKQDIVSIFQGADTIYRVRMLDDPQVIEKVKQQTFKGIRSHHCDSIIFPGKRQPPGADWLHLAHVVV